MEVCICVTLVENGKDASGRDVCMREKVIGRNSGAISGMKEYRVCVCMSLC